MKIQIYTDGSSNISTGLSGNGYVMYVDDGSGLEGCIGHNTGLTNNEEEYNAIIEALEELKSFLMNKPDPISVEIFTDSELVVKQMNGTYATRKPHLIKLRDKLKQSLTAFPYDIPITHVKREFNKEADAKAREGLKLAESMV